MSEFITVVIRYEAGDQQPSFGYNMQCLGGIISAVQFDNALERLEELEERDGHAPAAEPLSDAPCKKCGYNGPGYYQPATHKCAEPPAAWNEFGEGKTSDSHPQEVAAAKTLIAAHIQKQQQQEPVVYMREGATEVMHNFRFDKPGSGPWVPLCKCRQPQAEEKAE